MDAVVRGRRAGDSRGMRRVARRTWRATYVRIAPKGFIATILRRGYDRRRLVEMLADPRRDAFVAERDGTVVGYADCLEEPKGRVELLRIYVLPEEQGRGTGKALLAACVEETARRGASGLDVQVDRRNDAARAWYERRGFVRNGSDTFRVGRWERPQRRYRLALPAPGAPRA